MIDEKLKKQGFELSKEQREIVELKNNTTLINAGPGSGKTEVIAQRVKYLIENKSVNQSDILIVTYSRSATENMKKRIKKTLKLEDTNVKIKTFHSLARELFNEILKVEYCSLTEMGDAYSMHLLKKIAFFAELKTKKQKNIYHSVTDNWFHSFESLYKQYCTQNLFKKFYPTICDDLDEEHGFYKTLNDQNSWVINSEFNKEELKVIFDNFQDKDTRKAGPNQVAWLFDEWLIKCINDWKDKGAPEKYKHVFVDEFQDTNLLYYKFISELCEEEGEKKIKNLWCIGDLDQSIYSFSGAYPEIFKRLLKDFPEITKKNIITNRRSVKSIVDVSQKLIKDCEIDEDFKKSLIHSRDDKNPKPIWLKYRREKNLSDELVKVIEKENNNALKKGIPFLLSNIAILSPEINNSKSKDFIFISELTNLVEKQLNKKNIFQIFTKEKKIYEKKPTWVVLHLLYLLSIKNFLKSSGEIHSCLLELIFCQKNNIREEYIEAHEIYYEKVLPNSKKNFFEWAAENNEIDEELKNYLSTLYDVLKKNQSDFSVEFNFSSKKIDKEEINKSLKKIIDQCTDYSELEECNIKENFIRDDEISELSKLIFSAANKRKQKMQKAYWPDFFFSDVLDDVIREEKWKENNSNEKKIHVMSLHKSKGKEYKYVFIVNLTKNCFLSFSGLFWSEDLKKKFVEIIGKVSPEISEEFSTPKKMFDALNDIYLLKKKIDLLQSNLQKMSENSTDKELEDYKKTISILLQQKYKLNESKRIFYVGITRAKDYLYICSPPEDYFSLIDLISEDLEIMNCNN